MIVKELMSGILPQTLLPLYRIYLHQRAKDKPRRDEYVVHVAS